MAIYKGGKGRNDTFTGTAKADRFIFDPADLTSGDVIAGGAGIDTLAFTAAGAIGADALGNVRGVERVELANGANTLTLSDGFVGSATGQRVTVVAGTGNDRVDASALTGVNAVTVTAGSGNDTLLGGAGADVFSFAGGTLTGADTVNGGTGVDAILFGDQKTIGADALANVQSVEVLQLGDGGTKIVLTDGLAISANTSLRVEGGAGNDEIDVSGMVRDGLQAGVTLNGGAGDDVIRNAGGKSASAFHLYALIDGGAGKDTITMTGTGPATVVYDRDDALVVVDGGTLRVRGAATIDLNVAKDQSAGDAAIVRGFTGVDASATKVGVTLTGTGRFSNQYGAEQLIGGAGKDTITNAALITGGGGTDTLIGATATSTIFTLNEGDFARGESIQGRSGSDTLRVYGTADLTKGSVSGIRTLELYTSATGHAGSVIMSADQVAGLKYLQGGGELVIELGKAHVLSIDGFYDQSFGDVTVTVNGSAGADRIEVGRSDVKLTVHGGGGDDVVGGGLATTLLDGGDGIDTVRLLGYANRPVEIDLARTGNQSVSGTGTLTGFENVDLSGLSTSDSVVVHGSAGANDIRGTLVQSMLFGENGDDILRGGGDASSATLNGGAGDDILYGTGTNGQATMTGGRGADTFRWTVRGDGSTYDHLDMVTDFKPGEDHLEFARSKFGFAGAAFDTRVVAGNTKADVTGADLVIYTGSRLDSVSDVVDYIDAAKNGNGSGFFIAGTDSAGHTVLYHTLAGEFGVEDHITAIADLGSTRLTSLALTDFSFI